MRHSVPICPFDYTVSTWQQAADACEKFARQIEAIQQDFLDDPHDPANDSQFVIRNVANALDGIHEWVETNCPTFYVSWGAFPKRLNLETARLKAEALAEHLREIAAGSTDDDEEKTEVVEPGNPGKGVSLQDAAACFEPGNSDEQSALVKSWRNSRQHQVPPCIGKDPNNRSRHLYEVSALLAFLKEICGEKEVEKHQVAAYFRKVSRYPATT